MGGAEGGKQQQGGTSARLKLKRNCGCREPGRARPANVSEHCVTCEACVELHSKEKNSREGRASPEDSQWTASGGELQLPKPNLEPVRSPETSRHASAVCCTLSLPHRTLVSHHGTRTGTGGLPCHPRPRATCIGCREAGPSICISRCARGLIKSSCRCCRGSRGLAMPTFRGLGRCVGAGRCPPPPGAAPRRMLPASDAVLPALPGLAPGAPRGLAPQMGRSCCRVTASHATLGWTTRPLTSWPTNWS